MRKRTLLSAAAATAMAAALAAQGYARAQDAPPAPPAPVVAPAAPSTPTSPPAPISAVLAPPAVSALPGRPALAAVAAPLPPSPGAPVAAAAPAAPQGEVSVVFGGDNYLGIQAEEVTRENMGRYGLSGEPRGVGVREVIKGSPAERAGLRANDVIVRYDGEQVSSIRKLNRMIDESAPEHSARLTVRRGGSEQELTVTLGKRAESFSVFADEDWRKQAEEWRKQGDEWKKNSEQWKKQSEQWKKQAEEMRKGLEDWRKNNPQGFPVVFGAGRRIGVSTESLGKQLADYFGVSHGVLVTAVNDNSPADKAGLKAGDIVTEVDGERVEGAGALSRALNKKTEGEVTLTVVRDRKSRTVRVTPEKGGGVFEFEPGMFALEAPRATLALPRVRVAPMRLNIPTPRIQINPRPLRAYGPRRIL